MLRKLRRTRIAIIGGGASGIITAIHLARKINPETIMVIECQGQIARGVAYSTTEPAHLLNVRADNMSALADVQNDFTTWLTERGIDSGNGTYFVPRMLWGAYLGDRFATTGIPVLKGRVTRLKSEGIKTLLYLDNDHVVETDKTVLAMGHAPPVDIPFINSTSCNSWRYIRSVWNTWPSLPRFDAPILIVGSGLTAIDTLLRLRADGHQGVVTMVSRHGLLPQVHGVIENVPPPVILSGTQQTAVQYLRQIRMVVKKGLPWHTVVDSLRPCTNILWASLPEIERLRFRRHLFHRWNTVRHRLAPKVARQIKEEILSGHLVVRRGYVADLSEDDHGLTARVKTSSGEEQMNASMVMNCTAPDTQFRRVNDPLFHSLFASGLAIPGDHDVAFATDVNGALIGQNSKPTEKLFAIGPMRAGNLLETTAIPEIRHQAKALSDLVIR